MKGSDVCVWAVCVHVRGACWAAVWAAQAAPPNLRAHLVLLLSSSSAVAAVLAGAESWPVTYRARHVSYMGGPMHAAWPPAPYVPIPLMPQPAATKRMPLAVRQI